MSASRSTGQNTNPTPNLSAPLSTSRIASLNGGAFVGIFSGALLPCGGLAQSLGSGGTLLLVNRLANLFFTLLVFCIPQGHIFCPALDARRGSDLFRGTTIAAGSCGIQN